MLNLLAKALSIFVALTCASAAHAAVTYERLKTDDRTRVLLISGDFEFTDDARLLIEEAAAFRPTIVTFRSGGGNVDAAMRIGRTIRQLGLMTVQIRASECASACTLAFLGGVRRFAEAGAIGVHQSSFSPSRVIGSQDAVSAVQAMTAHIIGYLVEMGVDPSLLQLSLSVESSDMRYLTATEMRQYRVTTVGGDDTPLVSATPYPPSSYAPVGASPRAAPGSSPTPEPSTTAVESSRPNRVAIYTGLDFLGRDIGSLVVASAPTCAAECLANGMCKAFTFNVKTQPGKGPNCFLKSSQGQFDGNSAAISGMLLGHADAEPETMSFGVIDPLTNLYRDVDVVGYDLSQRPHTTAKTPFDCRIACVNNGSCAAFTFLQKPKQCWLKSGIGQSRSLKGAITGAKTAMTFAPKSVRLD